MQALYELKDSANTHRASGVKRENAASEIRDMNYPGSDLHRLEGDRKGQYAVKVSGNWRVLFEFVNGNAYIVDYGDYH
jgi:proteic killer suppression protein